MCFGGLSVEIHLTFPKKSVNMLRGSFRRNFEGTDQVDDSDFEPVAKDENPTSKPDNKDKPKPVNSDLFFPGV